jgi:hypothetical protein
LPIEANSLLSLPFTLPCPPFPLHSGDDFKTLNSLLNREVAEFESSPSFEAWDPASSSPSNGEQAHRLNEVEAEKVWEKLRFGLEDEVEERRQRAGRAAEERLRRAEGR